MKNDFCQILSTEAGVGTNPVEDSDEDSEKKIIIGCGVALHRGSKLASHPTATGSNLSFPEKFSEEKLSKLLRLINGAG